MKKIAIVAALLVICTVCFCGCLSVSDYDTEILRNTYAEAQDDYNASVFSPFDYDSTLAELEKDWEISDTAKITTTSSASSSLSYVTIDTSTDGYGYIGQKVYLKKHSYYKVTYTYMLSSVSTYEDSSLGGLYVGFLEDANFNKGANRTLTSTASSSYQTETVYFSTKNVDEGTIAIFVGDEDQKVSATAKISDFTLTRITKDAFNAQPSTVVFELNTTTYGTVSQRNVLYVVLGAVGTLLIAYVVYILRARSRVYTDNVLPNNKFVAAVATKKHLGVWLTVGVALFVRLLITLLQSSLSGLSFIQTINYGHELQSLAEQGTWLANYSMPYFLQYNAGAVFMPIALYILSLAGLLGKLIGLIPGVSASIVTLTVATVIKLFAVAADIGVVVIIYKLLAKRQGNLSATIMACGYSLIPVVFTLSAAWGSMQSIAVFFVMLAFYFILNKKYIGCAISYFVAALTSPVALIVSPFILFYTAMRIYRAIREKDHKNWIIPVCAMGLGVLLFWVLSIPFTYQSITTGSSSVAFTNYISAVNGANVYTSNAFNFQALLGNNFATVSTESTFVTILFIVFVLALFAVAYFRSKSRLQLVALAGGFAVIYWMFCNNMTAASLLIALPLLYLYAAMTNEKRVYVMTSLVASSMFINVAYLMMVSGSTSDAVVQLTYSNGLLYAMGAINLVIVLLFVILAYDAVVNNKAKEFLTLKVPYFVYFGSIAQNALITTKNLFAKLSAATKAVGTAIKDETKELKEKRKQKKSGADEGSDSSPDNENK